MNISPMISIFEVFCISCNTRFDSNDESPFVELFERLNIFDVFRILKLPKRGNKLESDIRMRFKNGGNMKLYKIENKTMKGGRTL